MTIKFIKNQLKKEFVFSKEFWLQWFDRQPKNEWVRPTNKNSEDYAMFFELFTLNLCEKKITPLWHNDAFQGYRIEFKITID